MIETVRRSDSGTTFRRSAVPGADEASHSSTYFRSRIGDRSVDLRVNRHIMSSGEGDLYLCEYENERRVVKILNTDSDYEVLEALAGKSTLLDRSSLMPLEHIGRMRDMDPGAADERTYIVSPWYPEGDMSSLRNMRRINPSITFDGDDQAFRGTNADYARVHADFGQTNVEAFHHLLSQMLQALRVLHGQEILTEREGIVHRDIRPQNIMVRGDGEYVLGDYGLVSALDRGLNWKYTRRFGLSHGYSPPEAYGSALLRQRVTRKYDYFSLGMTLLHLLGGRPAYLLAADGEEPAEYETSLDAFVEAACLGTLEIPAALPVRVRNLLAGLLTADPQDRWGADEISSWLAGGDPLVRSPEVVADSGIFIKVNRHVYEGEREVAQAVIANWILFRELLTNGQLEFQWREPDIAFRKRVEDAVSWATAQSDPETGLTHIVQTLWSGSGHVVAGKRYESDQQLGEAMLHAALHPESDDFSALSSYLAAGTLSAHSAGTASQVKQIEELAASRPASALMLMGCALTRNTPPLFSVTIGGVCRTVPSLHALADLLRDLLKEAVSAYLSRTDYTLPETTPVPGVYESQDGNEICIVQADGTILGNTQVYSARIEDFSALQDIVYWAAGSGNFSSLDQLNDMLLTHLWHAGFINRETGCRDTGSDSAGDSGQLSLSGLALFLMLFPAFRQSGGLSVLDPFFERYLLLLERIAPVYLPGLPAASRYDDPIAQASRESRADTEQYFRKRDMASFVRACGSIERHQGTLAAAARANRTAAVQIVTLFQRYAGSLNAEGSAAYQQLLADCPQPIGEPGNLSQLLSQLKRVRETAEKAQPRNLHPYMLRKEMDYLRTCSRASKNEPVFLLPNTTDAAEYYRYVQRWAEQRRFRL